MTTPRRLSALGLVAVTALTLTACKSSDNVAPQPAPKEVSPKLVLRDAAKDLAAQQAITAKVSLKGAPADVAAFASDTETKLTPAQAADLIASSLTITVDQGADRASTKDNAAAVLVQYAGGDLAQVRQVADKTYLLLDTTTLEKKNPKVTPALAQARAMGAMVPGADKLLTGQWAYLDGKDLKALTAAASDKAANPATDPAKAKETLAQVQAAATRLVEKTDLTRDPKDPTHLVATAKVADLATEVETLQKALAKDYPSLAGADAKELKLAKASTEKVAVDFWVKDGSLTALEVAVPRDKGGRVAVHVDFATGKPVTAPAGATKLDLSMLAGDKAGR